MGHSVQPAAPPPVRVVIDCDPGIDDVVTLALAARSPELDIVAVTTTFGNAAVELTTRNAADALELAGRPQLPVLAGAERPLVQELTVAAETHGESGVGYAVRRRDGVRRAPASRAERSPVLQALERARAPVTLVTLGPLTNLALALKQDRELVRERVRRHIGMFGTIAAVGNTNHWADFNAWCDPEAVDLVLRAGLPTEMVGLDVTRQMILTAAEVERIARSEDPLVRWLGEALRFYVEFHRKQERLDGCVVNDVLPLGELLLPGSLTFRQLTLRVDLDGGDHRGHTRVAPDGVSVRVAMGVDLRRMRQLLRRVFGDLIDSEPPDHVVYHEPDPPSGERQ